MSNQEIPSPERFETSTSNSNATSYISWFVIIAAFASIMAFCVWLVTNTADASTSATNTAAQTPPAVTTQAPAVSAPLN